MSGTDMDRTEVDARHWYRFVMRIALSSIYLWKIMEKWGKKYRLLVEQQSLFLEIATERKIGPGRVSPNGAERR
jgi:hypothetical protein